MRARMTLWATVLFAGPLMTPLHAQQAAPAAAGVPSFTAPTAFDVATVKPHPAEGGTSWLFPPDGYEGTNVSLTQLLCTAYGLREDQIAGAPKWADDEGWDVTAKLTELDAAQIKALTWQQRRDLLQPLLADRFHVKAHLETREGPVYNLVPFKGGVKVKTIQADPERKAAGRVPYGGYMTTFGGETRSVESHASMWKGMITMLAGELKRTVIDKSGINPDALVDMKLTWAAELVATGSDNPEAVPLPIALEQELGLHLEAARGPVTTLVIEHAERPTEN